MSTSLRVRVTRRTVEAEGICSFELQGVDGRPLPAFSAGSHVDVQLPGGLQRQYSLCNDPTETHRYLIAVLRDAASRGGSQALHDGVQPGNELTISLPRNHFALAHDAVDHLLLAGGIGITPLLCMAERLALTGARFTLHYCTRSPGRTAFAERIATSGFAARVQFHFDDGDAAQKLDLAAVLAAQQPGRHLYVCGPQGFMDAVLGGARAAGWPEAQLHFEYFGAAPADTGTDGSFQVRLASSGRIVTVGKDQTVAGGARAGECRRGVGHVV